MAFDFENYKGLFVAVPEPIIRNLLDAFSEVENIQILKKCVSYEPDNHHNAALCPYCSKPKEFTVRVTEIREGTVFCTDCPDHEACSTGYPCAVVQAAKAHYEANKRGG